MTDRVSDHFPKMRIEKPMAQKNDLEGRETVEEFLARGGQITQVPPGVATLRESGKKTREEVLHTFKKRGHDKARANNLFDEE